MKKCLLFASVLAFTVAPLWAADDEEEQGKDTRPYVSINQEDIVNKTDNPGANFKGLIDRLNNELFENARNRTSLFLRELLIPRILKYNNERTSTIPA